MPLVLLDIDGTLMWSGGAGSAALRLALEQAYGAPGLLEKFDPGGRTVEDILTGALMEAGFPPDVIQRGRATFYHVLSVELRRLFGDGHYAPAPCPGALELVQALLRQPQAFIGLLTGNPRATALIKLWATGFDPGHFPVGAYGDEAVVRADLLQLAIKRARRIYGEPFPLSEVVIVGDTVRDVEAGQAVGARVVAVATGGDTLETLQAHQPNALFATLDDTQAVLAALMAQG